MIQHFNGTSVLAVDKSPVDTVTTNPVIDDLADSQTVYKEHEDQTKITRDVHSIFIEAKVKRMFL